MLFTFRFCTDLLLRILLCASGTAEDPLQVVIGHDDVWLQAEIGRDGYGGRGRR